ncbi:SRPBCC family protein [Paenibacillus harenae]|uniref:SRPBCC family protein n=1 Tax=Paenibacillus harenae TaxID=306543 RepID=UPI000414553D|nr:SRPBCC domain-containing protein [Paenibacillus harenae]
MGDNNNQSTLPDIRQTVRLNASVQKVWNAVATSEGIAEWFMPNDFEPVEGHEFQLNAGPFGMSSCKVTVIDPPNRLSFTWGKDWVLTFELSEQGGQTEFTLIHSGWTEETVTEFQESHKIVRDRMDHGWVGLLEKLKAIVEA